MLDRNAGRRTFGAVVGQPILAVDDVGTKASREEWEHLFRQGAPRPTFCIETSPGNETWGWALADPVKASQSARWKDLETIRAHIVKLGLSDDIMDSARYIRLPFSHNSKPKYREAGGSLPRVKLTRWRPEDTIDLEDFARRLLGDNWRDLPAPGRKKGGTA